MRRVLRSAALASAVLALAAPRPVTAQDRVDPDLLSAIGAREIGPAGMSGRIAALDILPSDPTRIWVGAATGGVWRSDNGGISFEPVFDDQRMLGVGAIAIDPSAPDVVWVGAGEGNPRNSAGVGNGLYVTRDGGDTWARVGLEDSERIHRIIVHPTRSEIVWVGVLGPAWSDGQERGVYKTTDGGQTWRRVLYVDERTGASDLVIDPSNPMKLYAGMWSFRRQPWTFTSGGPGSGLYVSHDGGETWDRATEPDGMPAGELGRIGLAVAASQPRTVYALVEARRSALLRSDDAGATWQTVNDDPSVANRPFYYADIYVDPANELRIYNLTSRVLISEDGGRSFEGMPNDVHSDFHAMWIDPSDSRHLWVGTDGGVYESWDRADSWRQVDDLPVGQFYHISVDDAVPYNVYGGMQDNGSWKGPSDKWSVGGIRNADWVEVAFGDGFNTIVDPRENHIGYGMSQGGNLVRFDTRSGERKPIRPWAPDSVDLRFNWNAAIALDPHDVGTVYYGSQFVHRTTDRGDTWQIISPDLTTNDPEKQRQEESGGLTIDDTGAENHTSLLTIAPSPVQRELIWTGSDDGKVHLARAGGGSWEDRTENIDDVPDGTWIPHIEASKHQAGTAYVVFDDHRRGNWETYLYRTEDFGENWRNIGRERGIDGFLHTVEEDPVTPNLLFAGGEFGLFVSLDRGESWFKWTHGLPPAPVRSLTVHPRDHDLVVGTHGRAIWILDDIRPLRALAQNPLMVQEPVHLFEAPPAYVHHTAATDGYHFSADGAFEGETKPYGAMLTYWVGAEADSAVVTVNAEDGRTVRTFTGPAERGLNRVVWDLEEDLPDGLESGGGRFGPQGPEALPGLYTVTVAVGGSTAGRSLTVLEDPRHPVSMAERREKYDALVQAARLAARLARVSEVEEQVREGVGRVRTLLEDRDDGVAAELRTAADDLLGRLDAAADTDEVNAYRRGVGGMAASYDRPTEGQRLDLRRMGEALSRLEARVNAFLDVDLATFRSRLDDADLALVPRPDRVGG